MANPLPNEAELYARMEKEHINVHPLVWEFINHHVRNDLNWITMCIGLHRSTPRWILRLASSLISLLYKISRQPGEPPPDLLSAFNGTIERVKNIDRFLKNLREKTCPAYDL
ncbi:MAG: hypothetical protein ABH865_00315 [Candidatus Omnitrophota bacterium]